MSQTSTTHAIHRTVQNNHQHREINLALLLQPRDINLDLSSQPGQTQSEPGPGILQASYLQTESGNRLTKNQQLENLKENRNPNRQRSKNIGNCRHSYNLRIKRSNLSLIRVSELQFADPVVANTPLVHGHSVRAHGVLAHGVVGPGGGEGGIFLSANNSLVETSKGTDISINCRIARDSDYGTVS